MPKLLDQDDQVVDIEVDRISEDLLVLRPTQRWYDGFVFWGMVFGFIGGAIVTLLNIKRSGPETREKLLGAVQDVGDRLQPEDPVETSLEEGKAVARQLRTESS